MNRITWRKTIGLMCLLWAVSAMTSPAQTFTTLATLNGANNGAAPCPINSRGCPEGALVQGTDGNLYGTTYAGGTGSSCTDGCGTVFRITLAGVVTTLHSFEGSPGDGANPTAGLLLGTDGNFYGTTFAGGTNGYGTAFKITPGGKLTTLYSFCSQGGADCTDGQFPVAGLVQATNGNFYGTTETGGTGGDGACNGGGSVGCGTVFELTARGQLTTIYNFCSETSCADDTFPEATLIQGADGDLYGATASGGPEVPNYGSIFKVTLGGMLTTIYSFTCSGSDCPKGANVHGGLVQAADGDLYGTTSAGGANGSCQIYVGSWYGCGTVYQINQKGTLKPLYSFCSLSGCMDGEAPYAGLVRGTDGNFYGTTFSGFASSSPSYGTVFQFTPGTGILTTLYTFCQQSGCSDGSNPLAGLVQATNGTFYGTTSSVCGPVISPCEVASTTGTVFSISMGLGPFIKTVPTSGKVGSPVTILGNDLAGSTSVTFNGVAASPFSVNSTGTAITTTVPGGATTGYVQVTTASGTVLTSNVKFRVP